MNEWERFTEATRKLARGENGEARETAKEFLRECELRQEHARQEYAKAGERGFEAAKQIATLSAGSIVVIATFLSEIFPADIGLVTRGFVGAAFVFLGLSLVSAAFYMNKYFRVLN